MYYWSVQIKKSGIKIRDMDVEFEKDTEEGKKKENATRRKPPLH